MKIKIKKLNTNTVDHVDLKLTFPNGDEISICVGPDENIIAIITATANDYIYKKKTERANLIIDLERDGLEVE